MNPPKSALCLSAVLSLLTSCMIVSPPGTAFSSQPSGASVLVDGRDSGWVTPCALALDPAQSHAVTLTLPGYAPRTIVLEPTTHVGVVAWRQGVNGVRSTTRFPILLPDEDLFFPLRPSVALAPGRVFVRLRPEDAQ